MVPVPHQASEPGCDPRGAAFAGALDCPVLECLRLRLGLADCRSRHGSVVSGSGSTKTNG